MNVINPQLLLTSQVALLALVTSVFAASIIWLWCRQRHATALEQVRSALTLQGGDARHDHEATAALELSRSLGEELRRNLAATETQCVEALEQRDEADRQAVLRAMELRKVQEELAQLKAAEPAPRQVEEPIAAPQVAELEHLRQAHEAAVAALHESELAFKAQIEQLTNDKAALQAQIQKLADAAVASPPARPIQLPRPPLPPIEVLTAPVDDTFDHFPPAPAAPPLPRRKPQGEPVLDEAALLASSTELPSLDEAHETLKRLELQLAEKQRMVAEFTQEQERRSQELEAARQAGPTAGTRLHAAEKSQHAATTRLTEATEELDRGRRQVRALTRSLAAADAQPLRADDLTRIKGIKGGINHQLHAFGILSYAQIVQWDDEDVLAFSELLAFKNRIHRDKWQDQARALMAAKYGENKGQEGPGQKT